MFKFPKDLKVVEIGNIKVGADSPLLLIGTILYREEKKIRTAEGIDFKEAERQIETVLSLKEKTGFNFLLDVFFDAKDDYEKIINFVNEFGIPFSIDSEDWETRIKILKHCKENGISKNTLYNSINYGMPEEEREAIKDKLGRKCAFCGCTNDLLLNIDHMIPLSRNGDDVEENKQVLCYFCNSFKGSLTNEEFERYMLAIGILKDLRKIKIFLPPGNQMKIEFNPHHYPDFAYNPLRNGVEKK